MVVALGRLDDVDAPPHELGPHLRVDHRIAQPVGDVPGLLRRPLGRGVVLRRRLRRLVRPRAVLGLHGGDRLGGGRQDGGRRGRRGGGGGHEQRRDDQAPHEGLHAPRQRHVPGHAAAPQRGDRLHHRAHGELEPRQPQHPDEHAQEGVHAHGAGEDREGQAGGQGRRPEGEQEQGRHPQDDGEQRQAGPRRAPRRGALGGRRRAEPLGAERGGGRTGRHDHTPPAAMPDSASAVPDTVTVTDLMPSMESMRVGTCSCAVTVTVLPEVVTLTPRRSMSVVEAR